MIKCDACDRVLPVFANGRVRCLCGHRFTAEGLMDASLYQQIGGAPLCRHLRPIVGTADYDCKTKPSVYACDLHGLCMPKMDVTAAMVIMHDGSRGTVSQCCRRCDDYTPDDGLAYRQSIRIVTSFAPSRTDRQLACLASWRRLGMPIVAVQPECEIDAMAQVYEGVHCVSCDGDRPTIAELAAMAVDGPILLINSDIEIESSLPEFRRDWLAIEDRTLRVGCRWEVASDGKRSLQRWGIDAFLITPEMLADFCDLGFAIGQPAWDYWLILHYAELGYAIKAKTDQGLAHQSHKQAWTKADGTKGVAIIAEAYGIDRGEQIKRIAELTGRR